MFRHSIPTLLEFFEIGAKFVYERDGIEDRYSDGFFREIYWEILSLFKKTECRAKPRLKRIFFSRKRSFRFKERHYYPFVKLANVCVLTYAYVLVCTYIRVCVVVSFSICERLFV